MQVSVLLQRTKESAFRIITIFQHVVDDCYNIKQLHLFYKSLKSQTKCQKATKLL